MTDGTTLLGADDKAGIAEILALADRLLQHPELPHGALKFAFTPDEEVGGGVDHFDVEGFWRGLCLHAGRRRARLRGF